MARRYWLVKSEPSAYSWDDLVREGEDLWDGVRNHQARNNLNSMTRGDLVLFYHSVDARAVVGIARVTREGYPDPTTADPRWLAVDLEPVRPLNKPVTLRQIKNDAALEDMALIRQSRLSVVPISRPEFQHILVLGETRLPRSRA
jgi:predicted RNA-binding protein with PUA-like domain